MNGWDVLTWIMCAVLAVSAVAIFAAFLRDAGTVIRGQRDDRDDPEG